MAHSEKRKFQRDALREAVRALVGDEEERVEEKDKRQRQKDVRRAARRQILMAARHYHQNCKLVEISPRTSALIADLDEIDREARELSAHLDRLVPYLAPLYLSWDLWKKDFPDEIRRGRKKEDTREIEAADTREIEAWASDALREDPRRISQQLKALSKNMQHVAGLLQGQAGAGATNIEGMKVCDAPDCPGVWRQIWPGAWTVEGCSCPAAQHASANDRRSGKLEPMASMDLETIRVSNEERQAEFDAFWASPEGKTLREAEIKKREIGAVEDKVDNPIIAKSVRRSLFETVRGNPKMLLAMELAEVYAGYHSDEVTGTHSSEFDENRTFHRFCCDVYEVSTGEGSAEDGAGLWDYVKRASAYHRKTDFPFVPVRTKKHATRKQRRAPRKRSSR